MSAPDPDAAAAGRRAEMRDSWEQAAPGWGRRGESLARFGMPVAMWMIEHLELHPGQRVLELAGGTGEVGLLASELLHPGGTLICSDGAEAMLEIARARAAERGITNIEFKPLELEWIDLETASVDAVLCRWGYMLCLDPAAALLETRRVLRPGGRVALAVWDEPQANPWATLPGRVLLEMGAMEPPDPTAPGMFALAPAERLRAALGDAGFLDVEVDAVAVERANRGLEDYMTETLELSPMFSGAYSSLSDAQREQVTARLDEALAPFRAQDGALRIPGRSLVALAQA